MNLIDNRLLDETLGAYLEWREECTAARNAYRRWSTAPLNATGNAFREYLAAVDNEQHTAEIYAQLVGRANEQVSARPLGIAAR